MTPVSSFHRTTLHCIHAAITVCAVSVVMPPVSSIHRTTLHCISSSPSLLRSLSARYLLSCLLYHPSIARHYTASLFQSIPAAITVCAISVVMPPISSFHRTTLHCISFPVHPCCDHSLRGLCCHASCIILPPHDTALHLFQFIHDAITLFAVSVFMPPVSSFHRTTMHCIHAAITVCAVSVVMPPVSSFHHTTLHCISSSPSMMRSLSARSLLSCLLYHPSIARHCTASLPVHPCCDHSLRGLCCHASCIILPSHDTALHLFQSIHAAITLFAVSVVMPPVSSFHRTTLHCISSSPSMLRSLSARSLLSCLLYNPSIARHYTASLPVHPCCDHSQRGLCCHASCIILPSHDTTLHLFQSIHAAITLCALPVVMPPAASFLSIVWSMMEMAYVVLLPEPKLTVICVSALF